MSKTLTIVLLVLYLLGAAVLGFAGLMLVMASDSCGSGTTCNDGQIVSGVGVATLGQVLVAVLVLVWTIRRMATDRTAWWVPLVGAVASVGVLAAGAALTFSAASVS